MADAPSGSVTVSLAPVVARVFDPVAVRRPVDSTRAPRGPAIDSSTMNTVRLLLFTTLWTAIWAAPLPKLARRVELVAGLIPFAAFGLRVFAACFLGVPEDDPVRRTVAPLVDWVNGVAGVVPYQWVLDVTVAIGLVWFASIAGIPRRWRLATIWVMPAVAVASLASERLAGVPLERLLFPWPR